MNRVVTMQPFFTMIGMRVCACSDATDDEILAHCNRDNPSGTSAGWTSVVRATDGSLFREANKAPVQCADDPTRTHFVVLCW